MTAAETLIRDYLDLWNAGDIEPIWARIYHPDASPLPWDEAGMKAARTRIRGEGFDHSELHDLQVTELGDDMAEVRIWFTRVRADGSALPPGPLATLYSVQLFPEGWRITAMRPIT